MCAHGCPGKRGRTRPGPRVSSLCARVGGSATEGMRPRRGPPRRISPLPGRAGVAGGAEPPPEQLRPRPLLGPKARGVASAARPLEEGSLAGERREGARVSSLGCEGGGRANLEGGCEPREDPIQSTVARPARPPFGPGGLSHGRQFGPPTPRSSPTALDSGEDRCGCPRGRRL